MSYFHNYPVFNCSHILYIPGHFNSHCAKPRPQATPSSYNTVYIATDFSDVVWRYYTDHTHTTPTLGVQIRVRSGSTSFHSIPEESEFHSMGEGGVAASHRMSLADSGISHDMDAVVVGLSQFKNELLQLHALVSLFVRVTEKLGREKKKREKIRR